MLTVSARDTSKNHHHSKYFVGIIEDLCVFGSWMKD
jgi:hypothetical protein